MKLHRKNPFIKQALEVVAPLSLDNAVHPDKIRLNDAANYVARILHEERAADPTSEILEHFGKEAAANKAFVAALAEAIKTPKPDEAVSARLSIETAVAQDPSLVKKYKDQLKKWAVDDIDEQAASL